MSGVGGGRDLQDAIILLEEGDAGEVAGEAGTDGCFGRCCVCFVVVVVVVTGGGGTGAGIIRG